MIKDCCKACGLFKTLQGGLCRECYQSAQKRTKRPPKYIKPVSKKRQEQNKEYKEKKTKFMEANKDKCQNCGEPATDIHHRMKRIVGDSFTDESQFMVLCRYCHDKAHTDREWGEEKGIIPTVYEQERYRKKHGKI